MADQVIRAPRWERTANAAAVGPLQIVVGMVLIGVAFVPEASARAFVVVLGTLFVGLGLWMTVRAHRVAVRLEDQVLRYDGYVMSWSVPRSQITTVLDDGFVEWVDDDGRQHRRQIWLLTKAWEDDGTKFAPYWIWRREGLLRVRGWAGARAF
ncbi:hypothetical protein [Curtobacterium sp. MCSS17_015]|uniref:hypothetical protein n=1 Tax=Curtobacterium sp. MCSS17_015 TaxID=2175666 RepID=UPI000DA9CF4B|nr:hypothetical protein [Curtobacterium sp. MCSS17_015]WIB25678.1 hypothetical protein DEJ18_11535 [Curtobacterium sp. MCSS17_015]